MGLFTAKSDIDEEMAERLRVAIRGDFVSRGRHWYTRLLRWTSRALFRIVKRMIRRLWVRRRICAPFLIGTAAYMLGAIMWLFENGFIVPVTGGLACTPLMYWWLGGRFGNGRIGKRLNRRRKLPPWNHRRWYAAAYASLFLLTTLTAAWTPAPPVTGLWATALAVFWLRWVLHHRVRKEDIPGLDPLVARIMKARVLSEAVPIGTVRHLTEPTEKIEFDVDLSDGETLVKHLAAADAAAQIAKKANVAPSAVHVSQKTRGRDTAATIAIVQNNLIEGPVIFDQSWRPGRASNGTFQYHQYSDGYRGSLRLFTPHSGTKNALFTGDVGVGKTQAMQLAALLAIDTGRVYPILGDPQGGQSMPALGGGRGIVRVRATDPEAVLHQLHAIHAMMIARSRYLSDYRWIDHTGYLNVGMGFFDQDIMMNQPENPLFWPIIMYILDEAHMACKDPIFGEQIAELLEQVIKLSRKTGIAVWAATQYPGLDELGGKQSIRQNLINGNIIALRNSARAAGVMMLPEAMPDPFEIPRENPDGSETQGVSTVLSAAPLSSRPVYSRIVYNEHDARFAAEVAPKIMELDEVSGNALADNNVDKLEADLAAEVEQMTRDLATNPDQPARERIVVGGVPAQAKRKPTILDEAVAYLLSLSADPETADYPVASTGVIARAIGRQDNLSSVSTALGRGEKKGIVHNPDGKQGMWALGRAPEQAEKELVGAAA